MIKYFVLSAATLIFSLAIGCQNCGYRTAHCSRYETLVGTTRLASPQTNCRYNTCNAYNTCNTCNICDTQMLANNGQFCSNPYAQNGWYQQYAAENVPATASLLDATQQQTAQSETPLRWRSVTEEEQRYANSSVNAESVGIASALGNPAFGSPAPAPVVDPRYPDYYNHDAVAGVAQAISRRPSRAPQYPGAYPGQYPSVPPRAAGVDVPSHPLPPQYSNQYPNYSPRATMGVASALTPGRPMPGAASQYPGQYSGQYPNHYPSQYSGTAEGAPSTGYGSSNSDSMRWRHVTEEEQQYSNPSRMPAGGASNMTPGYGSSNPAYPNAQYSGSGQEPLTVPVYPENNAETTQTQGGLSAPTVPSTPGTSSTPEIDPSALPMPEPPTGTF